ncbi:MAG: hypothetical protein Ta2E_12410 [Mycoplasmoidaceae bacterium]|nr:MAG: hypothetical protein Ta2E_12410 [Mycoplasmoidaceae bacterium]
MGCRDEFRNTLDIIREDDWFGEKVCFGKKLGTIVSKIIGLLSWKVKKRIKKERRTAFF